MPSKCVKNELNSWNTRVISQMRSVKREKSVLADKCLASSWQTNNINSCTFLAFIYPWLDHVFGILKINHYYVVYSTRGSHQDMKKMHQGSGFQLIIFWIFVLSTITTKFNSCELGEAVTSSVYARYIFFI